MILVTGATGQVGSALMAFLRGKEARVRAGVRYPERAQQLVGENIEVVPFDFDDAESMAWAMDGIDHLFLLTPFSDRAVALAKRAIDTAKRVGIEHLVRLSTFGADRTNEMLIRWHGEIEQYVKESGIPYTIIRPNSFMENFLGPGNETIRTEGKIYRPLNDARVSFIAARDIGEAAGAILLEPGYVGRAIELTGPRALSVEDVAAAISRALDRHITYIRVTPETMRQAMTNRGMPEWMVDGSLGLYAYNRTGDTARVTDAVHAITGHDPEDIDQWVQEHAAAFTFAQAA